MNTGTPFSKLTRICIDWWSKFFLFRSKFFLFSIQSEHCHAGRVFFFSFFFVGGGGCGSSAQFCLSVICFINEALLLT